MVAVADRLNAAVAYSRIGRWFQLEGSGAKNERLHSRFTIELRAGITTWAAMAYIISTNAAIVSQTGGSCVCSSADNCISDIDYLICVDDVRRELITATAAASAMSSILMGVFANLPVALAPGLGINAYFTYSIVGFHGSGRATYSEALAAVFLEGWVFIILSLLGLRQLLARLMPQSLVMAVGSGIGIFIAFVGLSAGGISVVGGNTTTYVGLSGCKPENYLPGLPGYCGSGLLRDPTMWLGIFLGGILTAILMLYRIKGALLIGITLVAIVSWPRDTAVTAFPHNAIGDANFAFFKKVVTFDPLSQIGNVLDYGGYGSGRVWYALVTFLYVDILDTTGTLYSMAKFAGLRDPITGDFEHSTWAYCIDGLCISLGSLMGTPPVTAFIESATGISEGGKTGLTAVAAGMMFLISVFFAPIFASIPSWATGGSLVIVGMLMARNMRDINWNYIGDAIPAFLTIIMIPLTYNITYGIIAGMGTHIVLNGVPRILGYISGGRIVPPDLDLAEHNTLPLSFTPPLWQAWRNFRARQRDAAQGHTDREMQMVDVTRDGESSLSKATQDDSAESDESVGRGRSRVASGSTGSSWTTASMSRAPSPSRSRAASIS